MCCALQIKVHPGCVTLERRVSEVDFALQTRIFYFPESASGRPAVGGGDPSRSPKGAKFIIFMWGMFATLRRVLTIIAIFIPSLGLFSILHHWRWEQIPFRARLEYARRGFLSSDDKIGLFGLKETFYWTDLDRWDYSDPQRPVPPDYPIYTLLTFEETIIAGLVLFVIHFVLIMAVKILTSSEFRERRNFVNKIIHGMENHNYATPYSDWDEGVYSIKEFRARFRATCKEMAAIFCLNIIFTEMMMVPLWYTGLSIFFTYTKLFDAE